ncbi:THAP domain-containing 1 [Pelobates cultripes]|uniref:THAP domain-containing 1 n=1 Tax=Pelobates cultripes TaxID=61616 RepID=A0AAD1W7M4_PELCU|nr:THAP domain-containing 1 [Pelobates cultripes]
MCSDHFAAEAYSTAGQRKFLKPDAVPTIFACNDETTQTSKEKPKPHLCIKPELMETDAPVVTYMNLVPSIATIEIQENSGMFSSYPSQNELLDHNYSEKLDYSVSTSTFMFHKASNTEVVRTSNKGTVTSNYYGKRSLKTQTSVFQGKRNTQTSTREDRVMKDAFTWTGPLEDDIKLSSDYYKKPSFTDAFTQTDNTIQFPELRSTLSKPHTATLVETQFRPQPVGVISGIPLAVETTPQQHITTGNPDLIPECEEHVGYRTFEQESTQKIIECNTIQVSETKSSVNPESKVFRKCLKNVLDEGLTVAYLATDRHIGITKIMRDEYRQINHQFDLWHLKRKLSRLTKRKRCKQLIPWRKAIINQMWMSSLHCKGNVNLMREQWNSVLLHVVNQHRWDSGTLIDGCPHSELSEKDMGRRPWLVRDSPVHLQLTNFVKNKQLQKDLKQMAHFCHTGSIDLFRSLVLKFCPKHVRFSKDGMAARIKLAVLAHNTNVGVKHWHVKNISKTQTVDHVYRMLADILRHVSGELDLTWVSESCLFSELPQRNGHRQGFC